jgi:ribose transport system substrate-binding protein
MVAQDSHALSTIEVTQPLTRKLAGTAWILPCAAPSCLNQQVAGARAAMQAMGGTLKVVPLGQTPASTSSAFTTAATASPPPAAVLDGGTAFETVKQQVAQLASKKVPILSFGSGLNNTTPTSTNYPGVGYDVYPLSWSARQAQLMADWIGVNVNGAATKVLYVTIPDFVLFASMRTDFTKQLQTICAKCSVQELVASATGIGTTIPNQVVSAVQRDPSIKYVVFDFGDMVLGVPQALKGAGISGVQLVSQSGSAQNELYVKNGQQALDVAVNQSYNAWANIDAAARLADGQGTSADDTLVPTQLVTKQGFDNGTVKLDSSGQVEIVPNYQAQWTKLWASAK